ncbi:MAG: hypothetical protein AB2693_11415 [Candidatus Thiodiazotropha sp.]
MRKYNINANLVSATEHLYDMVITSKPILFFSDNLFSSGVEPVKDDYQQGFTRVTDEADGTTSQPAVNISLTLPSRHTTLNQH